MESTVYHYTLVTPLLFQVILVLTYNNETEPTSSNIYRFDLLSVKLTAYIGLLLQSLKVY